MCIKSEFKEICLKFATNGRSDKGFLLTSKVCPQGVNCPCHGVIYMYKIIKNVYKIRFRRDHFETCNIWSKRKGLSVVIKILSPVDCLPLPGAICIIESPHDKTNKLACAPSEDSDQPIKWDFKANFLNLQQMGKRLRAFCWHQHLSPRGCLPLSWGYIHV